MKKYLQLGYKILIIAFSIGCVIFTVHQARFFKDLKLDKIETKKFEFVQDEPINIVESSELNKQCYSGEVTDKIQHREYYNGVLNYLCETYKIKNIKVTTKKSSGKIKRNYVLAASNGFGKIELYYDNIEKYNPSRFEVSHILNHEYVHMLMFKNVASMYTMNSKSKKIIHSVTKSYIGLPNDFLYPSQYAYENYSEQLAEVIGVYLSKRMAEEPYLISNFEQDLYKQFMLNIK